MLEENTHEEIEIENLNLFLPKDGQYNKVYIDFEKKSISKGKVIIKRIGNRITLTTALIGNSNSDIQKKTEFVVDSEKKLYYTQRSQHKRNENDERKRKMNAKKHLKLTKMKKNKLVLTGYGTSGFNDKYSNNMEKIFIKGNGKGILYQVITKSDDKILYMSITY